MRPRTLCLGFALCCWFLFPSFARAGQVHVVVTNFEFVEPDVRLNPGDQVVWVWTAGTHTVTSGNIATGVADGLFDSGSLSASANGTAWSWKSTVTGSRSYFCVPHRTSGMTGTLDISTTGALVADFRITEVIFNAAGAADLIEITNMGDVSGNLGRYRIVTSSGVATIPSNSLAVPKDGQVVLHVNASGTNNTTNVFLPLLPDLPTTGSVALYVPHTKANPTFTDSTNHLVDFVQWNGGGQRSEVVATTARVGASTTPFWTAGQFVSGAAAGHSIAFCGARGEYGASAWGEIAAPNVGNGRSCSTPTNPVSWGRIKAIYR